MDKKQLTSTNKSSIIYLGDNMERQILHIDVNNAFLSWTALELLKEGYSTDIRTIPAIIGGDETRRAGIVLAKSMKAKQCGIVTGETIYQAKQKCPQLQVFPGKYNKYKEYSDKLYNLLLEYTDKIERYSIDECFLDMTNYLMNQKLIDKAHEIKRRVKEELGFTVNIGVSTNKLLAKMASDFKKPDMVHTLYPEEIKTKMWNLPVSELFMLGRKTVPKLQAMRIKTIGDLAKTDQIKLIKKFGKHGNLMWEYANGIDNSEVNYKQEKPKGIGNSITLPMDISEIEKLEEVLLALTEHVGYRLRKHEMLANVVNVQIRTNEFKDFSHQGKLNEATCSTKIIYEKAKKLLHEMLKEKKQIRLVGVRVDSLVEKEEMQISLFNTKNNEKLEKLDNVLDSINQKYGYNSVTRAGKMKVQKIVKLKDEK